MKIGDERDDAGAKRRRHVSGRLGGDGFAARENDAEQVDRVVTGLVSGINIGAEVGERLAQTNRGYPDFVIAFNSGQESSFERCGSFAPGSAPTKKPG